MEIVGNIMFDGQSLNVYKSLDDPYFLAKEVGDILGYASGKTGQMLIGIEKDEYLTDIQYRSGQKRHVYMINELGLYNVLSQSRKPTARKWRRIINSNLILLRKSKNLNITQQFEEWDETDNLFIDETTGELMEFSTLPGGDVDIRPHVEQCTDERSSDAPYI